MDIVFPSGDATVRSATAVTGRVAPPASLSVAELCRRAREETARYARGEPYDEGICYELLRRAIAEQDERCWQEVYALYHEQVLSWCRRAAAGHVADHEELAALTWAKFWRSYTPAKLSPAGGTAAVLRYLKMCARSVVVDAARASSRTVPLEERLGAWEDTASAAEAPLAHMDRAALWELVDRRLRDERERVLVFLLYEVGLRPADLPARRPDLFPTVREVYRVTRNVLDRLRRCRELAAWLAA